MTKLGKKNQKRLAKLVAVTLMCAGGGLFSPPSVASAEEVTVTNVTPTGNPLPAPQYTVDSEPSNSMTIIRTMCYPNTVDVLNITGTFTADSIQFYGGVDATASGKTVNINGTDIAVGTIAGGDIHPLGGYSVTGNHVNFLGGTTTVQHIYGGFVESNSDASSDNHVKIAEGSTVKYAAPGYGTIISGGIGDGDVDANTVTISGTLTPTDEQKGLIVFGGMTSGDGKHATGNSVTILDATFNNTGENNEVRIYGGESTGAGGNATGNTVTISGNSTFGNGTAYIYGGYSQSGAVNGNTVTITGDANLAATTMIYGGMAPSGEASNNIVNIMKAITVAHIMGGEGAPRTGNTLNIAATNVKVDGEGGVAGFQNMNFYLPSGVKAEDTMLTINHKNALGVSVATDVSNVTIGAAATKGVKLDKGDKVNLMVNEKGLEGDFKTTELTTDKTATGLTVDTSYKLEVSRKDANTIIATITDKKEDQNGERAKSLVETRAATTTFVNAGADMLASQGFAQAANAVALEAAEKANANEQGATGTPAPNAFTPFAAFGGSSMRAESGSYVNTKGFGLNIGFARELSNVQGKLLFGPMVEYGGGSYDSHLDDGTRGDGKAHYFGVGVMARQVNHDGFYYEGSLRGGRVTSDYDGNLDGVGKVDYDSSSNYFAAHLGAGKAFDLGKGNTLDGYCKYFYSHQAGDDTTIHIAGMDDERGHFDAVDSHRIRIGARLTHKINERNSFYGGLAYQYEFNGDARATFSGNGVPSPSLKGSSGLLELGWQVKPGDGPLKLDLGVTGWAGKQRGGSVQLGATWTF